MIAPNHPSHADPFAIYEACDQANTHCHIMAAWHVFAKNSAIMRKCLQWHGCFSIDRESSDLTAFRDAVAVLRNRPEPLVIFPEGDIYHCNDRVTPFREGAAAIAIAAARRSERKAVVIPTAIRYRYVEDPTPHIEQTLELLEQRISQKPSTKWRKMFCKPKQLLFATAVARRLNSEKPWRSKLPNAETRPAN
jgi:hypothetical protein